MTILVVIPARWGSTRLPGKPLIAIAGRTLLARCIDTARRAIRGLDSLRLVVATDDERIVDHADDLGCECVMTDPTLSSGSSRALAAADALSTVPAHVVNLQGDAPFTEPETIKQVLHRLRTGEDDCVTPVVRLTWPQLDELRASKALSPSSGTCCIRSNEGRAIWFSKAILPAIRDEAARRTEEITSPVFRHIGLYGYRIEALRRFHAAPVSAYEQLEGLEQLRLLELGMDVHAAIVPTPRLAMSGIDTAHDVAAAEAMIARYGDPFGT